MKTRTPGLAYVAAVLAVSIFAFGPWGVPVAAMLLLFWWLWRQPETVFHGLAIATLLALVVGLVLGPAVPLAREAAFRDQCRGHLKQQWLAIYNYHDVEGHLPPLRYDPLGAGHEYSWRVGMLPYMDYDEVYRDYRFDQSWDAPLNRDKFIQPHHRMYLCPVHNEQGSSRYLAVSGAETVWGSGESRTFADVTDDPATTILCIESPRTHRAWNEPHDLTFDDAVELLTLPIVSHEQNAHHTRRSYFHKPAYQRNVAMCDGSVRVLNVPFDHQTAVAVLTASGGEEVDVDALREPGPPQLDWSRIGRFAAFVVVALLPIALIKQQRPARVAAS